MMPGSNFADPWVECTKPTWRALAAVGFEARRRKRAARKRWQRGAINYSVRWLGLQVWAEVGRVANDTQRAAFFRWAARRRTATNSFAAGVYASRRIAGMHAAWNYARSIYQSWADEVMCASVCE